ncbi:MAG: phospholipid carrier-dependent glycosyltransferase, partial [Nitrososphaerales archaeon]
MELAQSKRKWSALHSFLKVLLAATLAELGAFVILVVIHAALPSAALAWVADFVGVSLGITSILALGAGVAFVYLAYPAYRAPLLFLVLLTASTLAAHLYVINTPSLPACFDGQKDVNGCIMDESYYVPAAETLLRGTQCGPAVPNCNTEHPFLSKALIAAGIAAFGDNAPGWRILNVLLGTFSLPLVFVLVLELSKSRTASYLSAALLALDVMFFSNSSAALLDVPMVFFALLAFVLYFYKVRFWKLDSFTLSGILLGLATLSKETAIFLLATLATYHLVAGEGGKKLRIICAAEIVIVTAGFGETSEAGSDAEAELLAIARRHGMRVVGPNCLGVCNTDPGIRCNATFSPIPPVPGRVGLLSQSGAIGVFLLERARRERIGISSFVSVGNKLDVSGNDLLCFWEGDESTDV